MSTTTRSLKQKLAGVSRLWDKGDYDSALAEVETLLKMWPGNAHLHVMWANLVQLQENPTHSLDEARQALQTAIELDKTSPAAGIELGHFLDAVDDDPRAAARVFADAATLARAQLIEGLLGQARALVQLGKKQDSRRCLLEVLHFVGSEPNGKRQTSTNGTPTKGRLSDELKELLGEVFLGRTA